MRKWAKNKEAGLSMMETIVAMAILVLGLFSGITLASYGINIMTYTRQYHEASNFAQEGIEMVRAERDSNWLSGSSWDQNLTEGYYVANFNTSAKQMELQKLLVGKQFDLSNIGTTVKPETRLYKNTDLATRPFFTQDVAYNTSTYPTSFYRQIQIIDAQIGGQNDKKIIRSSVVFKYKTDYKIVEIDEEIYNWKK
ncbi:hypothetical protein KKC60_01690 [Patescibacteria group bacterium]|nr:hypothetical protein [Patescibacteria group bacterium]